MPFLAPLAGPLIGAAGSVIGGLLGGRKSNLEKQIANKINPSLENLLNWGGRAAGTERYLDQRRNYYDQTAQGMLGESRRYEPMAFGDLSRASGFYNRLLSPSSTDALNEILGPQRQGIQQGYNNLIQTAGRTGARGGGRTSGMMDFGFAQNRDLMNLVPQARTMAAQGLLGTSAQAGQQAGRLNQQAINTGHLGLGYGQLGLGYGNLAGSYLGQVLGFANPALAQQAQQRNQNAANYASLGGYLGNLIGGLPFFKNLGLPSSDLPTLGEG